MPKSQFQPAEGGAVMRGRQLKNTGLLVAFACAMSLGLLSPGSVIAGQGKRPVCHRKGNGTYHRITIADAAYYMHLSHGDADLGDPVPGMEGYIFDSACEPIQVCPCDFSADDIRSFFPEGAILMLETSVATGCDFTTEFPRVTVLTVTDGEMDVAQEAAGEPSEEGVFFCRGWSQLLQDPPAVGPFGYETYTSCAADIIRAASDLGFSCTEFSP